MTTATVSKLKAALNTYLQRVKAGEEVLVSERGRPIARIVPVKAMGVLPDHVATLERQGLVRIGSRKLSRTFWTPRRPKDAKGRVLDALLEGRRRGR